MATLPDIGPYQPPRPSRAIAGVSLGAAGATGAAIQDLGNVASLAGERILDREATASAKDADVAAADKIRALLYDPETGFANLQGSAAVNARSGVSAQIDEIIKGASEGLSPAAQRKLKETMDARRERALMTIDTHASDQRQVWSSGARDARIASSYQDVIADPGATDLSLQLIENEVRGRAADEGWSPEKTAYEVTAARSKVYGSVAEKIAMGSPEQAMIYLQSNRANMLPSDAADLEAKYMPAAKKAEGRRIGQAWAMGGDYTPPSDSVGADAMAALGKINPIAQGVNETAASLGISPLDLATAMSYETMGTFDPRIQGPTTQWGTHEGLIQFGEPQASQYGADFSSDAKAISSQLGADGAVAKYLRAAGVQPGMGLMDIYSAINAGHVGKYNASDANNGGAPGTVADKVAGMDTHRAKAAMLLGWERSTGKSGMDEILKIQDPLVRDAAIDEYNLQGRAIQTENAVNQKTYLGALDEDLAYTAANGEPPANSAYSPDKVDALYGPLPGLSADENVARAAQGEEVKRQYETGVKDAVTLSEVNVATPIALDASIKEATAAVQAPGHTDEDVARLASLQKAVLARNAAIVEDSAAFVTQTNEGTKAYLEAYGTVDPNLRGAAAANYQAAVTSNYDRIGVPNDMRRVLPKSLAANEAKALNDAPAATAALQAQAFLNDWNNSKALGELMQAGLAPELGVAMRLSDNPGLMADITNLRAMPMDQLTSAAKTAMGSTAPKDAEDMLRESLSDYQTAFIAGGGPAASATFEQNFNVANKLALKYVGQGADPIDAGERAAAEVFPETPLNTDHMKLLVPVGMTEDQVTYGLEAAQSDEALTAFNIATVDNLSFPEFADQTVTMEAAKNGVWLNNSTGDGAVLHFNMGGYYLPVTGQHGNPYEVKFKDLAK